jgi:hypothetical protein
MVRPRGGYGDTHYEAPPVPWAKFSGFLWNCSILDRRRSANGRTLALSRGAGFTGFKSVRCLPIVTLGVTPMTTYPCYVVFDDTPQQRSLPWTADQFAEALRAPLAAHGVRVVRQRRAGAASPSAGFQAHGWSRSQYNTKLNVVERVVNDVSKS